mgnify:CR=1 FL=1
MPSSHDWKRTIEGRASVLYSNAKSRCKEKGIEIHITQEWIREHLRRGTCELTGIPFNLEPPTKGVTRLPDAPSLDRIDKHKHYTADNTRVILWAVNCALAEYGTEIMLPILQATVKGILNAQAQSASSVPDGNHQQGEVYPEHRTIPTARIGEDRDDAHHHCGADARKDADNSPQTSSGDSVGYRSEEVGAPSTSQSFQNNGDTSSEVISVDFYRRHLSD